jgi:hypothetical protein
MEDDELIYFGVFQLKKKTSKLLTVGFFDLSDSKGNMRKLMRKIIK